MRRHNHIRHAHLALCTLVTVACTGSLGPTAPQTSSVPGQTGSGTNPGGGSTSGGSGSGAGSGVGSGSGSGATSTTGGTSSSNGSGTGAGSNPSTTSPGNGSTNPATGVTTTPADPTLAGTMLLRHLSQQEYLNTVRDLLNDSSTQALNVPAELPIAEFDIFPFPEPSTIGATESNSYESLAEALASNITSKVGTILTCTPTAGNTASESACLTTFLNTFGLRAFRRPLTTAEVSGFQALYQTGRTTLALDFNGSVALIVEAMLQSPGFLYHWEQGPSPTVHDTVNPNVIALDPYAIASRLSYFLTSTMPDQTLLAAAQAGQLTTSDQIVAQAQRLLKDTSGKAAAGVQNFFAQLLQITTLDDVSKDPTAYPNWAPPLQTAMETEFRTFFSNNILTGSGLFSDLFTSKSTVVNKDLAPVYGLSGVTATAMQTVTLDANRSGFLTMPAFLAVNGASNDSNGIYRGHAVYMQLLCHALTPPQNVVVPTPPPLTPGETSRQSFAAHSQAACAQGCHNLMDGFGFAFENYDGIGQYRTMDNGSPVDSSATIHLDGKDQTVANGVQLSSILSTSAEAQQCFATQWVRYAVGRPETDADAASINSAAAAFSAANYNVRDLLVAVATSRTFRFRTPSPGEMLP
jgi:Protein of unknown function (DUF1592)/Protein of unknown function (DUF1588)/Protein of unknown function (DUF1595)/Protein of unknown function (DUF1585)